MGLLNLLLGQPDTQSGAGVFSILAGQSPQVQQAQVQPQSHPQTQSPQPQDPIIVNGDPWKPKQPGWLGDALDTILMLKGKPPVFQQRKANESLTEAMPGFASDPLQTIHRIAQIPGEANTAYKMYDQYTTDQEKDQSREIRQATQKDLITQRLAAMASAATPKNYDSMRQLMTDYVKRWPGEDPNDYDIPSSYDKNALDAMSGGGISAKDQQAQALQQQAIALRQQAITNTDQYRNARLGQIDNQQAGVQSRFEQSQHSIQGRFDAKRPSTMIFQDSNGNKLPGIVSPDGTKAMLNQNGKKYGFINGGKKADGSTNWVPVGEIPQ